MASRPVPELPPEALASLRQLFARLDFSESHLLEVTGLESFFLVTRSAEEMFARLAEAGPCGAFARVMLFGSRGTEAELSEAIAPMTVRDWVNWGLLERHPDGKDELRATLVFYPVGDLVLLFDRPHLEDQTDIDHVMSLGGGTSSMRFLVPRGEGTRALDLGTGGGTLALLTARTNASGLGVDINERAIAFAKLNAALNDIDNVAFAAADMFDLDAVADADGYDAIYAQPPFVIRPDAGIVYRDAVGRGDEMVAGAVQVAARRLRPGGMAVVFCNWIVPRGGDGASRLRDWVEGLSCDTLVLKVKEESPADYATRWLRGPTKRTAVDPEEHRKWLAYFDELDAGAFATGAICLRRRSEGQPWLHLCEAPERIGVGAHDDLVRLFSAVDFISAHPPEALLDHPLVSPPHLRIRQELTRTDAGWSVAESTSALTRGLMFELNHDAAVGDFIQACDGEATSAELAAGIAERHDESLERVKEHLRGVVPMLLLYGFLRVADRD